MSAEPAPQGREGTFALLCHLMPAPNLDGDIDLTTVDPGVPSPLLPETATPVDP